MTTFRFNVAVWVMVITLSACGRSDPDPASGAGEMYVGATQPATNEGEPFDVASDPQATYRLLRWTREKDGNVVSLTRRDGPSGTSFSRIKVDCSRLLFKARGEGDTREAALRDVPYDAEWSDLVSGSIKDVTVRLVCNKAQ